MKILYLCTYYHRAMIFRDAMNCLEEKGNTVMAFNAVAKGATISDKYKSIMDEKVIHCECFRKMDRYIYFFKQKEIELAMRREMDICKFQLIHSHTLFNGGWAALKLHERYRIPYIVSVRNTDLNDFLKFPFFKGIAKKIIDNASGVLFLSEAYKTDFLDLCFRKLQKREEVLKKSVVITNGVEEFWLEHKGQVKCRNESEKVRLLCVGKIDQNKNMRTVLEATQILKEKRIDTFVTIIGQVLDQRVLADLKRYDNIEIIDYMRKEELIDFYKKSDIYVMPSFHESFGRVYAEAMTQGVPIIYTRGQGFYGLFPDGYVGFSVNPSNANDVAVAIQNILSNYESISEHCIEECNRFDWNVIGNDLNTFYYECVNR